LRFWESRFPHIKPLKRGGGRRYYRPDDIDLLRGIRRLLYSDGYTIKGVQRILREQGMRTVQSVGQGLDVASLTASRNPPLEGDATSDEDSPATAAGEVVTPRPHGGRPLDDAKDGGEARHQVPAMARSAPNISLGSEVGVGNARIAKAERTAPVAATVVTPLAAPLRSGLAVRDLDRLKQALGELEACRRLLDKAMEGR
ncbi:MAG: MerR family transcriptional regulator, partial [Bradyrhizobiaceae bacterium]|nr:MerR family transcriptional regulator [Bradyrhizobiaceae bacterium]